MQFSYEERISKGQVHIFLIPSMEISISDRSACKSTFCVCEYIVVSVWLLREFLVYFLVSLADMQFLLICLCCGRSEFCGVACTLEILCTHFIQILYTLVRV